MWSLSRAGPNPTGSVVSSSLSPSTNVISCEATALYSQHSPDSNAKRKCCCQGQPRQIQIRTGSQRHGLSRPQLVYELRHQAVSGWCVITDNSDKPHLFSTAKLDRFVTGCATNPHHHLTMTSEPKTRTV